jgi:hypothetical protein
VPKLYKRELTLPVSDGLIWIVCWPIRKGPLTLIDISLPGGF